MISALFWDITQRIVIVSYRHLWTTYRSIFKGQDYFPVGLLTFEDGTDRLFRNICKVLTHNMTKDRTSRLPRDGIMKSRVVVTM
jgi:hypothetical protein